MDKESRDIAKVISVNKEIVCIDKNVSYGAIVEIEGKKGKVIFSEKDYSRVLMFSSQGISLGAVALITQSCLKVDCSYKYDGEIVDSFMQDLNSCGSKISEEFDILSEKEYPIKMIKKVGDKIDGGETIGYYYVKDIEIPLSAERNGKITKIIEKEKCNSLEYYAKIDDVGQRVGQEKGIENSRKEYLEKISPYKQLNTSVRSIDIMYPFLYGGVHLVVGGFGTGKSTLQQHLFQNLDFEVVIFVACGERGNEVTHLLQDLQKSHHKKIQILVVNLSNMSRSKRELSIYLGALLGTYYAESGLKVGLLMDSLSRWGEALKEISGVLKEIPGEGGYRTSFRGILSSFFEYAGVYKNKYTGKEGSLTMIGSLSRQKGDLQDFMVQTSKKIASGFLYLDLELRKRRCFPTISWTESFSKNILKLNSLNKNDEIMGVRKFIFESMKSFENISILLKIMSYSDLENIQKYYYDLGIFLIMNFYKQVSFSEEKERTKESTIVKIFKIIRDSSEKDLKNITEYDFAQSNIKKLYGIFLKPLKEIEVLYEKNF